MSNKAAVSLKVLAEAKTDGVSKVTTFRVDPNLVIFEKGFNLRDYESEELLQHIDRLYEAMKAGAFVPPIDVRVDNGKIVCVEGHCRVIAANRIKKEIPDFTLEARQFRGNEQERTLHMLGTGSGQKALSPLEQGMGYLRLIRFGLKPSEIAAKLGVSRVTIDNGLTLAEAPAEVQQMVRDGAVSSTTAREAVKQGSDGVEALKSAVAAEKSNPSPATKGGKKKVTAKKLRGTAAQKKNSSPAPTPTPVVTATDEVSLVIKREQANAVLAFIRNAARTGSSGEASLDNLTYDFADTLEIVLL